MIGTAWVVLATAVIFTLYTYVGYPLALRALAAVGRRHPIPPASGSGSWPKVSISLPAYNEGHQIAETIESLLALDYPEDLRQILVISDASTDDTDAIVRRYSDRGVELIRQERRTGKTAAENLAARHLNGDILVNTDASVRIHPHALKPLIRPFDDPSIGLTSGRDVSVGPEGVDGNPGEAGYVGYEMGIRDLETAISGIVGASGCFYAMRRDLSLEPLPESLSRDFASALITKEAGFRSVSMPEATCSVPRTTSLKREYRRKVRTMARGMETLFYKRALLNPFRHGLFAWMLFSHKVCRWLVPWVWLVGLAALGVLGSQDERIFPLFLLVLAGLAVGAAGWGLAGERKLPLILAAPAFALMGNIAALRAAILAVAGDRTPAWEPTRRVTDVPPET